ncbi:lipoate--protein ligase family protein [Gorillibacterium sp. sgz5001074]|uniref:lipoate--protein ligase family protein n=1 Tax=Gorillibacterium sp. sgz5001074 TaxID=3446695 RepID=UPI003F66663B
MYIGQQEGSEPPVWRLIRSGACSPAENMAVDEAILTLHSEGRVPPTVRFYGWAPATLSIGYFQKAEEEVDVEEVSRQGIGFVRRPTGGRAVLHDAELTYSIVVSESYPGIPRSVTEAYRVLSEGLRLGFVRLGLHAEMTELSGDKKEALAGAPASAACFDSPSWYELVVEGRKVAGSAQVRQKGVVLQHGSILLELDTQALFRLLRFRSEESRNRLAAAFERKAVAINPLLRGAGKQAVSVADAEKAFTAGLEEGLGIRLVEEGLTREERELADRLVREKYGTEEWNLRR